MKRTTILRFMRFAVPMLSIFALWASPASAQQKAGEGYRVEVFGGYSYLNFDGNGLFGSGTGRQSAHGFNAGTGITLYKNLAGEFNLAFGTKNVSGVGVHDWVYAGGPRVNLGRYAFLHALVGGNRISAFGFSDTALAVAIGGGVHIPVARHLAVITAADYLMTRHDAVAHTQNNIRASGGLAIRF